MLFRRHAVVVFLTFGTLVTIVPALAHSQQTSSFGPVHTGPMPDSRFYSLVFRHLLYLQANGEQAAIAGGMSPSISRFYTDRAGASASENALLLAEAAAWKAEVDPIDKKAHSIIDTIHAQTPGGRLAPGQTPPEVPQQLIDLQVQRDNITLKHVADLKKKLGTARFASIDNGIHRSAHLSFKGPRPTGSVRGLEGQ